MNTPKKRPSRRYLTKDCGFVHAYLGLDRIIYIRCIYGMFARDFINIRSCKAYIYGSGQLYLSSYASGQLFMQLASCGPYSKCNSSAHQADCKQLNQGTSVNAYVNAYIKARAGTWLTGPLPQHTSFFRPCSLSSPSCHTLPLPDPIPFQSPAL